MRWSEDGYLSQIVLTHALRQASVSLILGVRQNMKLRHLFFLGILTAGSLSARLAPAEILTQLFPSCPQGFAEFQTIARGAASSSIPPTENGTEITLIGGSAFPGGTLNLLTEDGWYIVIQSHPRNPIKQKLPQAVSFSAAVKGRIGWIYRQNKVIVLIVESDDYKILETT
jgi:hypothetical protein